MGHGGEISFLGLKVLYNSEHSQKYGNVPELLEMEKYRSRFHFLGSLFDEFRFQNIGKLPFPEFDTYGMSFEDVVKTLTGDKYIKSFKKEFGTLTTVYGVQFFNNIFAFNSYFENDYNPYDYFTFNHQLRVTNELIFSLKKAKPLLSNYTSKRILKLLQNFLSLDSYLFKRYVDSFINVNNIIGLSDEYIDLDGLLTVVSKQEEFLDYHYHKASRILDYDEVRNLVRLISKIDPKQLELMSDRLPRKPKTFREIESCCRHSLYRSAIDASEGPTTYLCQEIEVLNGLNFKDFEIEVPLTSDDLILTATELNHCVDTYLDSILKDEIQVLNLKKDGKRCYTISLTKSLNNYEIDQFKGDSNDDEMETERGKILRDELISLINDHFKAY